MFEIISRINHYLASPDGNSFPWFVTDIGEDFIQLCLEDRTASGTPFCRFIEVRDNWGEDFTVVIAGSVFPDCYKHEDLMEIAHMYSYTEQAWNELAMYEQCECIFESDNDTHDHFSSFTNRDDAFEHFKRRYQKM